MRFEVFIPAANARGLDVSMDITARNWLAALKLGLERCGEDPKALRRTVCDIRSDASVRVSDAASRRVFKIKPLAEGERVESTSQPPLRSALADSSPHTMLLHHVSGDSVDLQSPEDSPEPVSTPSIDATTPSLPLIYEPEAPDTLKFDPSSIPTPDEEPLEDLWDTSEGLDADGPLSDDAPPSSEPPPEPAQVTEADSDDVAALNAAITQAEDELDFVDLDEPSPVLEAPSTAPPIEPAVEAIEPIDETIREDKLSDEEAVADEIDAAFAGDERQARTMMMRVVDAEMLKERGASAPGVADHPVAPLKARPQARISTAARMKALPSGALRPDSPINADEIGHREISQEHDPQLEQMLATHRKQSSSTLKVVTAAHLKVTSASQPKAISETALEDIFLEIPDLFEDGKTLEEGTDFVMNLATNAIASDSAAIIYATPDGRELYFATARGPGADAVAGSRMPIEKGIAGFCTRHGVTLMVDDVREEPRFYAELTDELDLTVTSMMCVPIQHNGRVYGCIQLLNHEEGRLFSHAQLDALGYIGFQLGKFIHANL